MRKSRAAAIRNRAQKSALRTALKRASSGTAEEKRAAVKLLDRAARKGLIHRNAAARHKSQLAKAAKSKAPHDDACDKKGALGAFLHRGELSAAAFAIPFRRIVRGTTLRTLQRLVLLRPRVLSATGLWNRGGSRDSSG